MKPGTKLMLAAAALILLLVLGKYFRAQDLVSPLLDRIRGLGVWGILLFIGTYIAACILFVPGTLLTLGGGAIYGLWKGTLIVSAAATLGGTCAFLIGRYAARGWVEKKIETNPKFKAIDEAVAREGWKIVGLTRLSPVFPFNLLNYAYGVTQVSLKHYFFASWIGMLPGTLLYVYIGSLAGDAAAAGAGSGPGAAQWAVRILGLAATVAVTVFITRLAKKTLQGYERNRRDGNQRREGSDR